MAKSIIKEIIIVLLLCLAIILVLGILLYEYVPITKTIPNEVAYTTPSEVKEELLSNPEVDESKIIMTYEVNQEDLNNYKKIQDYKPGKANPFAPAGTSGTNTTTNGSANSGSSNSGNSTSGTTTGGSTSNNTSTSGGTYFPDKGTK